MNAVIRPKISISVYACSWPCWAPARISSFDQNPAKNGIGADYLDKVKQTFLRERETAMKTNGFWIDWLATTHRYKEDPTIILDPSRVIARMTPENVKAAAKRYIDFKQYYQAVLLPAAGTAPAAPAAPASKK